MEIREQIIHKVMLALEGRKAGNGCPCAKGCDTVILLPGYFGSEDDGDTQEIWIIPTGSCVLMHVRVTIYPILSGESKREAFR